MLKYNTFRSGRYERSSFVEGKYLLASENTDLELERINTLRQFISKSIGDVSIDSAFEVDRVSPTQILIKSGKAYYKGLPFFFRSPKDQLVTLRTTPTTGFSVSSNSQGMLINFDPATLTGQYTIYVTAQEQLITASQDAFLQNVNIPETTAQKIRLQYFIDIVPTSMQQSSPSPYIGEAALNFVNEIVVVPNSGISPTAGIVVSANPDTTREEIDGSKYYITLTNGTPTLTSVLPEGSADLALFEDGKLVDVNGTEYHIVSITSDASHTSQRIIAIDLEIGQTNPDLSGTFTIRKKDVYAQDDSYGYPLGKLRYPIAIVNFETVLGIPSPDSSVTDLRTNIISLSDFEKLTNTKFSTKITNGGNLSYEVVAANTINWTSAFNLINPAGLEQTIRTNSSTIVEGGSLVYEMNLLNGGNIDRGILNLTVDAGTTDLVIHGAPDLSSIRVGNVLNIGGQLTQILAINSVSGCLTVSPAISTLGACQVYRDSFYPGAAPIDDNSFVLAVRSNNIVYIGDMLALESGKICQLGNGITSQNLTYIGASNELDSQPNYTSVIVVTQNSPLNQAISLLDAAVGNIESILSRPVYDERILYPAGLSASSIITIPLNSRNANLQENYIVGSGDLMVFSNTLLTFETIFWQPIGSVGMSSHQIQFLVNLPSDTEIHFRKGTNEGLGGGGGSLQASYNLGNTITTTTGVPVAISGPAGQKLLTVAGNVEIDGVIDPTGIQLVPQLTNPLAVNHNGIWLRSDEHLIVTGVANPDQDITQQVSDLQSGIGINFLSAYRINGTATTIPAFTPIYSIVAGQIAPTDPTSNTSARAIGITLEAISPSTAGLIAYAGMVPGITGGYGNGAYLYLDITPGTVTENKPSLPVYPVGFNVVKLGVIDGNNLFLQIENIGIL